MIEIKAYIKEFKREEVAHSLMRIDGVTGASFSQVIGFGRGKDKSSGYSPENDPFGYVKHLKVEIELRDSGYPGSTYTLIYNPEKDLLFGLYYHAVQRQNFDVVFVRSPNS